jgi:hypothetical protein
LTWGDYWRFGLEEAGRETLESIHIPTMCSDIRSIWGSERVRLDPVTLQFMHGGLPSRLLFKLFFDDGAGVA